jgi:hypothetical protein
MLHELVASWQAGALTQEDLYYNLTQGGLLEPGVPLATWQARLKEESMLALLNTPVLAGNGQEPPALGTNGMRAQGGT